MSEQRVTFVCDDRLKQHIEFYANKQRITVSKFIKRIVESEIKRLEGERALGIMESKVERLVNGLSTDLGYPSALEYVNSMMAEADTDNLGLWEEVGRVLMMQINGNNRGKL